MSYSPIIHNRSNIRSPLVPTNQLVLLQARLDALEAVIAEAVEERIAEVHTREGQLKEKVSVAIWLCCNNGRHMLS